MCCTELFQLLSKLAFLGSKGGADANVAFTMPTTVLSPPESEAWIQAYPSTCIRPEQGEC